MGSRLRAKEVGDKSQYRGVANFSAVTYAQGCERWSNDQSGFPEAIATAEAADVAVVVVGTWSVCGSPFYCTSLTESARSI